MSCERNLLACKAASAAAGISALSSRAGNTAGVTMTRMRQASRLVDAGIAKRDLAADKIGEKLAPALNTVMNITSDEKSKRAVGAAVGASVAAAGVVARLSPQTRQKAAQASARAAQKVDPQAVLACAGAAVGAALGAPSSSGKKAFLKTATAAIAGKAIPPLGVAQLTVKTLDKTTAALGSAAGAVTKTGSAGEVTQERKKFFVFKAQQKTPLWNSSLTPLVNRQDTMLTARNITSSKGVMFQANGKTWHSGTITVRMPGSGRKRTITHLQSMSMPASHYYFDRPVSGEHAVGLATGQVKAEDVPGFRGGVSSVESLVRPWAEPKHQLIKIGLHWPAGSKGKKNG